VVEEPDVVVDLLQRTDLRLDELVELRQVGSQLFGKIEIHHPRMIARESERTWNAQSREAACGLGPR
jgi:hypothetical protein